MSSVCLSFALDMARRCSSSTAAVGLIQIADAADKAGFSTMTAGDLAAAIGCSDSSVRTVIKSLVAANYISAHRLTHRSYGDVGFLFVVRFEGGSGTLGDPEKELPWWATEAVRRRAEKSQRQLTDASTRVPNIGTPPSANAAVPPVSDSATHPVPVHVTPVVIKPEPRLPKSDNAFCISTPESSSLEINIPLESNKTRARAREFRGPPKLDRYPGDLTPERWSSFARQQRRPLTGDRLTEIYRLMVEIETQGDSVEAAVQRAIASGWSSVYPSQAASRSSPKRQFLAPPADGDYLSGGQS